MCVCVFSLLNFSKFLLQGCLFIMWILAVVGQDVRTFSAAGFSKCLQVRFCGFSFAQHGKLAFYLMWRDNTSVHVYRRSFYSIYTCAEKSSKCVCVSVCGSDEFPLAAAEKMFLK